MLRDTRKRIVLIDDHLLLRQGLERLLNTDEFVVIEEAGNAQEGMDMVREMQPDGVVLDIGLPDGTDGIELTKQLLAEFPHLVVVILSAHEEPEIAERALAAGAMAFVRKSEAIDKLRAALTKAFSATRTFAARNGWQSKVQ